MKELQDIIKACKMKSAYGRKACLCTVVEVSGSAYRRPGARMVVFDDGTTAGNVSGGCLDRDIVERAQEVIKTGESLLVEYDTSDEFDIVFGAGLGCSGKIQIFLEALSQQNHFVERIAEILSFDQPAVFATCFFAQKSGIWQKGDRLILSEGNSIRLPDRLQGTFNHDGNFQNEISDAESVLATGRSLTKSYETHTILFELIQPTINLVVCGAGNDAAPVVRLAKELGWHVTVFDTKPAFVTKERFPLADRLLCLAPEQAFEAISINERSAFAIMTHNFLADLKILEVLSSQNCKYIGLLGPRKRFDSLLAGLSENSIELESLSNVYAPIGLNVGAETPEEIALAIISEIQAVMTGHTGGLLRDCIGPMHAPSLNKSQNTPQLKVEEIFCRP